MLRSAATFMDLPEVLTAKEASRARKSLYRQYTNAVHGHLGHGNRVVTPDCVAALIRE